MKTTEPDSRTALRLCTASFIAMGINGIYSTSSGLVMPQVCLDYGLDYNMGGLLLSLLSTGNFIASFATGIVSIRFGRKPTTMLLCLSSVTGYLLLSFFSKSVLLLLAFLLIGISKGAVYSTGNILVRENSINPTKGMNLLHASFAVGSLFAAPIFSVAKELRLMCLVLAACAACLQIIWFSAPISLNVIREDSKGMAKIDFSFLKTSEFWIPCALVFFEIGAEVSVTGWLVTYFRDASIVPPYLAGWMLSLTWLLFGISRISIAHIRCKQNAARQLVLIMSLCSCFFFAVMIFSNSSPVVVAALCGLAISIAGIQPTTFGGNSSKVSTAHALSFMLPLCSAGGVIMPAITGLVATKTTITGGISVIGFAMAAMLLFSILAINLQFKSNKQVIAKVTK